MVLVWLVVFVALLIPLVAVVLDSQLGRALAARLERQDHAIPGDVQDRRIDALETEVERLTAEVQQLREASQFFQQLLEEGAQRDALPPGEAGDDRA